MKIEASFGWHVWKTWDELTDEQKKQAAKVWENERANDYWLMENSNDEWMASLQALADALGVKLSNWSIGMYSYSYIRLNRLEVVDNDDDMSIARRLAWLENNLYAPLRIPWKGHKRKVVARYGRYYRPGLIPPCPLTGVCYDEDLLDALRKGVLDGMSITDSFKGLADVMRYGLESEYEYLTSEECLHEQADWHEYYIDEEGEVTEYRQTL